MLSVVMDHMSTVPDTFSTKQKLRIDKKSKGFYTEILQKPKENNVIAIIINRLIS